MTPYREPAKQPAAPKPPFTLDGGQAVGLAIVMFIWGAAVAFSVCGQRWLFPIAPPVPSAHQLEHCMSSLDSCVEVGQQLSRTIDAQRETITTQQEIEDLVETRIKRAQARACPR